MASRLEVVDGAQPTRKAFVMGFSGYAGDNKLKCSVNDAVDFAQKLVDFGAEVTLLTDCTLATKRREVLLKVLNDVSCLSVDSDYVEFKFNVKFKFKFKF